MNREAAEKRGGQTPEWTQIPAPARRSVADAYTARYAAYAKTIGPHTPVDTEAKNDAKRAAKAVVRPFVNQRPVALGGFHGFLVKKAVKTTISGHPQPGRETRPRPQAFHPPGVPSGRQRHPPYERARSGSGRRKQSQALAVCCASGIKL
jgi:hypothetical protein